MRFLLGSFLSVLMVGCAILPEKVETAGKSSLPKIKTGIFVGRGPTGEASVMWYQHLASSPELELTLVDSEMVRAGALTNLEVLVMPGGSSPLMNRDLKPEGHAKLKEFIRNGGGYIGTCAGCCLMMAPADDPSRGIGVMPFYRAGSKGKWMLPVDVNAKGAKALGVKEGKYAICYSHGPILEPDTNKIEGASFEVWGTNAADFGKAGGKPEMTGRAALIGGTYGKGRVFVTSCHPERYASTLPLVAGAFRYVTGRTVTFPTPKRSLGAVVVAFSADYPAGIETARTALAIDAETKLDLLPLSSLEIYRGALIHADVLVFPPQANKTLESRMAVAVKQFADRGGRVVGWGTGVERMPKYGQRFDSAADLLAYLKSLAD